MIESIITSKTRIRLLTKFFLNNNISSYLRSLETEFQEAPNGIRVELIRLENAGLLATHLKGNKKMYKANTEHPLYIDIHNIILKKVGIDEIIHKVLDEVGNLKKAYLTGDLAKGTDSRLIDITLIGNNIDMPFLGKCIEKVEDLIDRKIRIIIIEDIKMDTYFLNTPKLLLWEADKLPKRVQ